MDIGFGRHRTLGAFNVKLQVANEFSRQRGAANITEQEMVHLEVMYSIEGIRDELEEGTLSRQLWQ